MARNRKSQSAELRFGPALKALLICFFIGGAGIGYVYQKDLLNKLGDEKLKREQSLNELRVDNRDKGQHLDQLKSQGRLEQRVEELGLNLQLPSPSQIVVLPDSPPFTMAPARVAGRAEGTPHLARGESGEQQSR